MIISRTEYAYYERVHGLPVLRPVGELEVKSLIALPRAGATLTAGRDVRIHGAAWTGDSEVTRVEVRPDAHERYMQHMWRRGEGTVFKDGSCASANSYYLDRHKDASLPLPHTPWWRAIRGRWKGTEGYSFGAPGGGRA